VTLRDWDSGSTPADPVAGMFVMVGATPHTDWLPEAVSRDDWGFVPTGPDAAGPGWPLQRAPAPLETTMPGVFAVGDVRQKAPKRVAAAVGDGSVVITQVLDHLAAGA
jgi:thioredoxin reductase (NADPH)